MNGSILKRLSRLGRRTHRRIFISYRRRGDSAGYGGRIADSLVEYFGGDQCFQDVEHIEPGVDFVRCIEEGIGACEVLIVVIGPDWTSQMDVAGRPRIQDPGDWVRIEVAAALRRNVRVIPTLVGGAHVPEEDQLPEELRGLCYRQAHELSDSRWSYDVGVLLQAIEKAGVKALAPKAQAKLRQRAIVAAATVVSCGLAVAVVYGITNSRGRTIADPPPVSNPVRPVETPRPEVAVTPMKVRPPMEAPKKDPGITADAKRKAQERIERQLAATQKQNAELARLAEQARRESEEAKRRMAQIAAEEPKHAATPAPDPIPMPSAPPVVTPAWKPDAVKMVKPNITSLPEVKKLYLEKMPNDLDEFIRAELTKQLNGVITVVLVKEEADAILNGTGENRTGTGAQITGRYLGLHDTATGAVSLTDRTGTRVLWSSEAGDRSLLFGSMRRAGPRKVAERLVKNLKKALDQR